MVKDGMVNAKASAVEIRLHFNFYGGKRFDPKDRIAVLGNSALQGFNFEERHGLFIAMPEVAGLQCVVSF
uniref:Dirigent protein n=1 Tax=Panagrellus redivivus TaxID=6233 RepID=A0A7E4V534_PANRE